MVEAFGIDRRLVDQWNHDVPIKVAHTSLVAFDIVDTPFLGDQILLVGNLRVMLNSAHLLHKARVRRLVKDAMRGAAPDLYAYIGEAA
jgi:hypothetical protein